MHTCSQACQKGPPGSSGASVAPDAPAQRGAPAAQTPVTAATDVLAAQKSREGPAPQQQGVVRSSSPMQKLRSPSHSCPAPPSSCASLLLPGAARAPAHNPRRELQPRSWGCRTPSPAGHTRSLSYRAAPPRLPHRILPRPLAAARRPAVSARWILLTSLSGVQQRCCQAKGRFSAVDIAYIALESTAKNLLGEGLFQHVGYRSHRSHESSRDT